MINNNSIIRSSIQSTLHLQCPSIRNMVLKLLFEKLWEYLQCYFYRYWYAKLLIFCPYQLPYSQEFLQEDGRVFVDPISRS